MDVAGIPKRAPSPPAEEYEEMPDENADREDDQPLLDTPQEHVIRQRVRLILPEVPTFLYFLALVTLYPVQQFWLFDHFSNKYTWDKANSTDYCDNSSETNSSYADIENKVQSETNDYVMYTGFVGSVTAIFPTLFLGPLTDKFGRKFALYVGLFALFGSELLTLLMFLYNLSPDMLYLSNFFIGLGGSYGLFLAAAFGMIADITSPGKQRAFRVAVMEASIAVSSSIGITTSGIWVKHMGYIWPMGFSLAVGFLATLYTLFLIPETFTERHHLPFSCKSLVECFSFYVKDTPNKRRFKLLVYLIVFLICIATVNGETNFGLLYYLHKPFCWSKMEITIFNGVLTLLKWVFVMAFITVGRRWVSEPVFTLIGCVSAASCYLLRGLAWNDLLIFIAAGTSLMTELVSPMCRTLMSKVVSQNEQGALFSSIGVLQMVISAVSGIAMSSIYNVGLGFFLGLPYLVLTALTLISIILLVVVIIRIQLHPEQERLYDHEEKIIN